MEADSSSVHLLHALTSQFLPLITSLDILLCVIKTVIFILEVAHELGKMTF